MGLFFFTSLVNAAVTYYPGTEILNGDLTVGFSNPNGITVDYSEFGDDYILFDEYNLSLNYAGAIEVNFSEYNNVSSIGTGNNDTLIRFNVTHAVGNVKFFFNISNPNNVFSDVYIDSALTHTYNVKSFSWSYNGWSTHDFEIRGAVGWGNISVNVYNESNMAQLISPFGLLISNQSGTETYQNYSCTSGHIINISQMPYGDNIVFLVNATGYRNRVYYYNVRPGNSYNFTFYLPPLFVTGDDSGGGIPPNETVETSLYYLRVIETITTEYTEVDRPVEDATVEIKRYNNISGVYVNVSTLLTDANGYVNLYLLPYQYYKIFISKDGYDDKISDYIPQPPNQFGQTEEKWFRIVQSTEIINETDVYIFWDEITYTATMLSNNTLYVVYDDSLLGTTNCQLYIYEFYNGTFTSMGYRGYTSTNSFSCYFPGLNSSRMHYADLYINHSLNFSTFNLQPVRRIIYPVNVSIPRTKFDLEARIAANFGPGPLGPGSWCPFIICMVSLCMLCCLGPFHVGFGIILSGLSMSFMSLLFGIWLNNAFPVAVTGIIGFVIAIGVGYIMVKQPAVKL